MKIGSIIAVIGLIASSGAWAGEAREYIHGTTYDGERLVNDYPGFGKARVKLAFDCATGHIEYDTWEFASLKEFVDFVASEDRLVRYGALVVISTDCNAPPEAMETIRQVYRSKFASEQNELATSVALGIQQTGQAISQASQSYSQNMNNYYQTQQAKQVTCRTSYSGSRATTRCY
jgi:hypothetical protein